LTLLSTFLFGLEDKEKKQKKKIVDFEGSLAFDING